MVIFKLLFLNSFSDDVTLKLLNDDYRQNYIHRLWPTIKEFVAKAMEAINKEVEKTNISELQKGVNFKEN